MVGTSLNQYRITASIGSGGMGEVFRAADTRLGRDVAIKVLPANVSRDPQSLARFEREAKALATLNHPNIAAIYGFEADRGTHFIVLELVEGETLAERLRRGALPLKEALLFAHQMAEAIQEAHEKGIVHRDLKPGNVKITPHGRVKVLDFGLAKLTVGTRSAASDKSGKIEDGAEHVTTSADAATLVQGAALTTTPGLVMGTPAYMSPEQARGQEVDKRTDVWAFGCCLFECLSGCRPFQGETPSDLIAEVLKSEPDWSQLPAEIPREVVTLLRRCLEKEPSRRLSSMGDIAISLEETTKMVASSVPAHSRSENTPLPPAPSSKDSLRQQRLTQPSVQSSHRGTIATWWKFALPAIVLAMILGLVLWKPRKRSETTSSPARISLTEAQQLTQRARALIDNEPLAVRETFRLAEDLSQRAVQLDPKDGEAWATLARATIALVGGNYDDTPARRQAARSQAERSIQLAPDSSYSGLAMAEYSLISNQPAEAERRLRELERRFPLDVEIARTLTSALETQQRRQEAIEVLRAHANSPAGRAALLTAQAYDFFDEGKLADADLLLDEIFAGKPNSVNYLTRLLVLWTGWGNLDAAGEFVERMPPQLLQEDAFVHHAANVWMHLGQTEKALEILRRIPRDFLEEKRVRMPKGLLTGRVLLAAGRTAAAEVQFRQALSLVEQRQASEPSDPQWISLRAWLLALLGEKAQAQKQYGLWKETVGTSPPPGSQQLIGLQLALGMYEEVIQEIQEHLREKRRRWPGLLERISYDPLYAPIRTDPRVQEVIALGQRWLQEMRQSNTRSGSGTTAVAPAPDAKSIAVLAFENMSADKDNEYFSDGIAEEILNALARIPGLRVAARTSCFSFKGKNETVQRIGEALHVGYLLEGSVRRAGDQLRITAQLINVGDGFRLWSDTFDRKLEDVFAIQTEVAQRVQEALKVKLLADANSAITVAGTDNLEAYDLYLRARQFWNRRTGTDVLRALDLFQQATEKDPKFAAAYVGLASSYSVLAEYASVPIRETNPKARAAALRALELDSKIPEAYAVLGGCAAADWDLVEAEQRFREALVLNPNHATSHHWYSIMLADSERWDEAIAEGRKAQAVDPLAAIIQSNLGERLAMAGRCDEALVETEKALKISSDFPPAHLTRGKVFLLEKKVPEAIAEFEKIRNKIGETPYVLGFLGYAFSVGGRTNEARQTLDKLKSASGAGRAAAFEIAFVHLGLREMDQAFVWLERSAESHDRDPRAWKADPFMGDVVKDGRYAALLKKFGLDK